MRHPSSILTSFSLLVAFLIPGASPPGPQEPDTAGAGPLTLELVSPELVEPIYAPVRFLVWRLSEVPDSVVWSVRAGSGDRSLDLSGRVARRGRELIADLPPGSPLEAGVHRVSADVCVRGRGCATSRVTLRVRPAVERPPGDGTDPLLRILSDILRFLISPF